MYWRSILEKLRLTLRHEQVRKLLSKKELAIARLAAAYGKLFVRRMARFGLGQLGPHGERLLAEMLDFDSARRPTAVEALRHRYFDDLDSKCPSHPRHRPACSNDNPASEPAQAAA